MTDRILIIEDEDSLRRAISRYLKRSGAEVAEAATCAEAFEYLDNHEVDIVLCDIILPDGQGFEVADRAAHQKPMPSVIVMTGDDRIDNAISALQYRASDFLLKPFSFDALDEAIERSRTMRQPEASARRETAMPANKWRAQYAPGILGSHPSLLRVFGIIERVADTDCSTLVTGDSGTGKELVARAIHAAGSRRKKPFITVNCAAIPENLLESELFGHAKGAFTGATQSRVGRFTAADGGTLFLDEIGELPLSLQAKLLRVLQEKEVSPVGEAKTHTVDVHVVAATNRDIEEMVESGKFREDLLYRLNVIPIELPALRERRSDIPELVHHFIEKASKRRDRRITGISETVLHHLTAYDWPGNVRQLENTIERMVVLKSEGTLELEDLPAKIRNATSSASMDRSQPVLPEDGIDLRDAVEQYENALILQALERTGWNKNKAANILRMNRTTLVEKIKKKRIEQSAA
ncbi:MAG: sigma-54 dependent transcriptional regulator [Myxococcota bacterium]